MKTCYFTATGNCLHVARAIGGELLSIPQLMKRDAIVLADDAVGLVVPVYACEMPMMVREFLGKARIETNYFFVIYTYGMGGHEEAMCHAEMAAREAGLELAYANAIQMVDNYLPGFEMQDQLDTLPAKNVEGQLARVVDDIAKRRNRPVEITPEKQANMELYKVQLAEPILRKETAQGYIVDDACIRCGICAQVCPADNIIVDDDGLHFADSCEVCYACIHNCPQGALHHPAEQSTIRFRNESVRLKDIIAAND